MTEVEILEEFKLLAYNFKKIAKRVLQKRPLSVKKEKVFEYITLLCTTYNDLRTFIEKHNNSVSPDLSTKFSVRINKCKAALVKCGIRLKYSFEFLENQEQLHVSSSDDSDTEFIDANAEPSYNLAKTRSLPENLNNLNIDTKTQIKLVSVLNFEPLTESCTNTMATVEQKRTCINMCATIIRNNYDGNPLGLESFIDKINLIEELSEQNLIPTLLRFIISKLEGKARESVPADVTSMDAIKQSLRNRIKPDNSKVVAGKIASVRVINGDYAGFSKKVEDLADSLERSLIVEGITQAKAHEMAVEQTVTTCRANAKTELVKSILASSTFHDAKDVVAKMIIEQSNEVAEKNVLRLNTTNDSSRANNNIYNQRRNNFRNNNAPNYRQNYGNSYNYRNNNNFQNYRNNANFQNFRHNNFQNYSGNTTSRNNNFNNASFQNRHNFVSNGRQFRNEVPQRDYSQAQVRSLNVDGHQQETIATTEM